MPSTFAPEPPYTHGQAERTAVLLCNLGTPDEATAPAVRRYLAQFLGDPRVVEIPRLAWWPILHGIILRVRPRASAKKYAAIWTPRGSPLAVESEALRQGLESALREHDVPVALAMLYTGGETVGQGIDRLLAAGVGEIIVVPMFPQYCGATTGAVFDQVSAALRARRHVPSLRFIASYHDHPEYIAALAARGPTQVPTLPTSDSESTCSPKTASTPSRAPSSTMRIPPDLPSASCASSLGWKSNLTVPGNRPSSASPLRMVAAPMSMAVWASCPHACMMPGRVESNS